MTDRYDAIVIGAGHNGLVCACTLGRAGMRVLVCEARPAAGGMTGTRSFGSGYRVPALAHVHYPLSATLRKALDLDRFGYVDGEPVDTVSLSTTPGPVVISGGEVRGDLLNVADSDRWHEFRSRYLEFAAALAPLFERRPPRLRNMVRGDRSTLARLAWRLRFGLGRDAMYEFLRVAGINIHDVLDETFEDERLKGAIALDAVLGSAMGPRTPGTVLTWLQRIHGELNGRPVLANETLTEALHQSARAADVAFRFESPVQAIAIEDDRAVGVVLAGGERLRATRVVAALDPRKTFTELVGAPRLDTQFANRVSQIRGPGVVGKLHLGLTALPEFTGCDPAMLRHRLLVAPSMRYVERAFNASKYGRCSEQPALEITIPSLGQSSLAPAGHHVMSVNVAYLPYRLKGGWTEQKPGVVQSVLGVLEQYAPGIGSLVADNELLSPADIEGEYGAVQGHWHHGELALHQSFMLRPLYGAAQYDTPVVGLYLCSAGCHPGGGLTGLPGQIAARRILQQRGKA